MEAAHQSGFQIGVKSHYQRKVKIWSLLGPLGCQDENVGGHGLYLGIAQKKESRDGGGSWMREGDGRHDILTDVIAL